MLKKAEGNFNIDLKKSWFVKDTTIGIKTGINVGTKTAFIL